MIILGGKLGSGVRTVAFKLREQLEDRDIAVEQIDDCTFHKYCPVCRCCVLTARYQVYEPTRCKRCPDSLDAWALSSAIRSAVKNVTESSLIAKNGGNGLVIAQGRHVCSNNV